MCQHFYQFKGHKGRHPGEVVHCLLRSAMEKNLQDRGCEEELKLLLKEADVASDWRVDPILKAACQDVVLASCDTSLGATNVMVNNYLNNNGPEIMHQILFFCFFLSFVSYYL